MINDLIDRNREVIRQPLRELASASVENTNAIVNDALDYFERTDDATKVRGKLKERGAVGIRKKEGDAGYETYVKQRTSEMIDSGEYEVITSGIGTKIINNLSTLFTNPTQSWQYLNDNDEPIEEDDLAGLFAHREAGGFNVALPQADWISNAVGSGPLLVSWSGGHLFYSPFSPACLYAKYHDQILDDGVLRGVNYKDLEDASVVVVETNTVRGDAQDRPDQNQYLAIFGRSYEYPYGRHVQYTAQRWDGWPDVGDPSAVDYVLDSGEIANPLSWLAATGNGVGSEYPIVLIDSGISVTSEKVAPVTTSLYENCLEIDVAFSRSLKDSLENALGTKVITAGMTTHLPKCLSGAVHLLDGQTMDVKFVPNSNAQIAFDITKDQSRSIAEGYGVPGYMIIAEPGGIPESGVALAIRTQPLLSNRQRRARINSKQVAKLFDVEKGLYQVYTGEELLPGVRQVWDAGRFIMPESPVDKITRLKAALDAGAITYVQLVRDYHNLATDDDAKRMIETMNEDKEEFPAPAAPQAARPGLPPGIVPRGPRGVV